MPPELMANIFQRLHMIDKLMNAWQVCSTWREICKDPPVWKVINVQKRSDCYNMEILTKKAVDLSCGELIDISIDGYGFCNNDLLHHIVISSKKLKRLRLVTCYRITDMALSRGVKRLPHLETLEIHDTIISAEAVKDIGQKFPQLKSFMLSMVLRCINLTCDGHAFAIANSMRGLCHLEVFENEITNDGLRAILDGCTRLQSRHLRMCSNLDLGGDLGKLCNQRVKHFKHDCRSRFRI